MVTVKLFAYFREGRGKELEFDENQFSTPGAICEKLDIEEEEVGILLINGFHAQFEDLLAEGDLVALYPPVAGG